MFTYVFGEQVDMTGADFSIAKYAGGVITSDSPTKIVLTDSAGDRLTITGKNFKASGVGFSGAVTGFVITDSSNHTLLTATHLNVSLGKLASDRGSESALLTDLFSQGVSITGSALGDVLAGGVGNDILLGGGGNDTLIGGLGNDRLDGGAGNNTASYATAGAAVTVAIKAGAQNTGGAGTDTLIRIQNLIGSKFGDTLTGNGAANILTGGLGNDVLKGGGGADVLIGGAGADTMTGGSGKVRFVYQSIGDSTNAAPDTITDFHNGDKIDLSAIDANTGVAGHQAFHFGATAGHAGDVVVSAYDAAHNRTAIRLYVNGDATADATIWLTGDHHTLTAAAFTGLAPASASIAPRAAGFVSAVAGFAPSSGGPETFSNQSPRALTPILAAHH